MEPFSQAFGWDDFRQPHFFESKYSLRFELGGDLKMSPVRFMQAMDRARAVASFLFSGSARLKVVVPHFTRRSLLSTPAILRQALDKVGFAGSIEAFQVQVPRDEDEAEFAAKGYKSYLCLLDLPNRPDQILPFLWANIAMEMPIRHEVGCLADSRIMDLERGLMLFPYDDRGMDAVAISRDLLRPCYLKFNDWLLDYDREWMDACFAPEEFDGA